MTAVPTPQGTDLARRRRALHLTRAQLAAAIGCSMVSLRFAEAGQRTPPRAWWQRADAMTGAGGALLLLFDGLTPGPDPLWPAWDQGAAPRLALPAPPARNGRTDN
jgi:hypothetical protein